MKNKVENKHDSKQLNILAVIHSYLEKPKFRLGVITLPFIFGVIFSLLIILESINFGFSIPYFLKPIILICSIILLIDIPLLIMYWKNKEK